MFAIHKPTGIYIGKLSLEEVIDKYGTATPLNDKQKLAVLGWIELSRHKCFNFVELKRGQYVKASYFLPIKKYLNGIVMTQDTIALRTVVHGNKVNDTLNYKADEDIVVLASGISGVVQTNGHFKCYYYPNSAKISYLIGLGNVNVNGIVCNFAYVPFLGVDEFSIIA